MVLDALYRDRDYARFFVLETIARVPYFGECCSFFTFLPLFGFDGIIHHLAFVV